MSVPALVDQYGQALDLSRACEGQYRPGPWVTSAGTIGADWGWNYWQRGYTPRVGCEGLAIVEACVTAYSQTIAMCPGTHWRARDDGARERITTSALSRILRQPNAYQGPSDFLLNLVRWLYSEGNAYALAIRNDRNEVDSLHLMTSTASRALVAQSGEIFYGLGGNPIVEYMLGDNAGEYLRAVPARDVLHVRLHTPRHPLQGETPLVAAALNATGLSAMQQQNIAFYMNQRRPSFGLKTDWQPTRQQAEDLDARLSEKSTGWNAGKVPLFTHGLTPIPISISQQDAQFIETMRMNREDIAMVFRVPLQILGLVGAQATSTESLMQGWLSGGLNFAINHIEQAFDRLFKLSGYPIEYTELDTNILLRTAFKDLIDALARSVQGGMHAPNEARTVLGLPPVDFGGEPRVQQQVVPLSAAAAIPSAPPAGGQPPADAQPAPTNLRMHNGRSLRDRVRARRHAA